MPIYNTAYGSQIFPLNFLWIISLNLYQVNVPNNKASIEVRSSELIEKLPEKKIRLLKVGPISMNQLVNRAGSHPWTHMKFKLTIPCCGHKTDFTAHEASLLVHTAHATIPLPTAYYKLDVFFSINWASAGIDCKWKGSLHIHNFAAQANSYE